MATQKEKKALEEQKAKAVSLCPEDMAEGGGLLDNIRATVTAANFEMSNYGGNSSMMSPMAHIILQEPDGETHDDQWWTCGKTEDWMPSDDGKYLIPVGLKKSIHKSSNLGMLMQSMMDCGFPVDKFDADIGFLVGLEGHWQQVATGREKKKSKDGKEYDPTCLCLAEIFKFPWEKGPGKAEKKGTKAKSKTKDVEDTSGNTDDVTTVAQNLVLEILAESGGEIPKKGLPAQIMLKRKGEDQAFTNQVMAKVFDDLFLGAEEHPWVYADGVLTVG
jgi:hypothetical protein